MSDITHLVDLILALFSAEIPVFILILHMSNRIVKLETQIDLILKRVNA